MKPAWSRRFRRSQQAAGERLTRAASSDLVMRHSAWRMVRICRSRLSSFMAPIIAAQAGKPKNLRRGALWARAAAWRRHCLTVTGAHGHFRSTGKAATEGGAEGPRWEERRVGKEGVSTGRPVWATV